MKIVVNVRGINASGKSTAVREYCRANGLKPVNIQYNGNEYRVMIGNGICVIGWYKPYSKSEGCDAFREDKEVFKGLLSYIMREKKPDVIVYEKQIWSTTFKLTWEISQIARKAGYKFLAVQMCIDYQTALNRLFGRNGGDFGNLDNFDGRFRTVYRSKKSMIKSGLPVLDAYVSKISKENMQMVIPTAIAMYCAGKRFGRIDENIAGKNERVLPVPP